MVFKTPKEGPAPIEMYTYYSMALLLDLLKEKGLFDSRDMKLLIKRINARLKKEGYK